jgi:AraC-like DNA-binding protein
MQGDNEKAIKFLKKWKPGGSWVLTCISTDKKSINTNTFTDEKDVESWLSKYNGQRNIYFHVNSVKGVLNKKAHKEDILSADWLHIDIDPSEGQDIDEERERVLGLLTNKRPKGIPEPTVIIFSGGGYQGFWRLKDPILIDGDVTKAEDFELYNKRLEQIFGGDNCHNVDRIMRLPGTINIPDAKKRKKGRVEELAKLLQFESSSHDIEEFKKAQGVQISGGSRDTGGQGPKLDIPGNIERIDDLSELDEFNVPDRVKIIIAQGMHPEEKKERDNSRSAWLFDCVCSLVRCNVPDAIIYALITDPDWNISSSVLELKSAADKYARRQITRAKEYCEDPVLTELNDIHAVIGNVGGKCVVIEEQEDDVLHRSRITMSSFETIRNRYSNRLVNVGTDANGKAILIPLGKYWLGHPMRRQFDTIKFLPQGDKPRVYNLWRGFNVEPREGDCSLYLEHLKKNVCKDSTVHYDYLIKWMARVVQYPATPGEVAIVLRGGKGTGKGYFARTFGRLFGRHYLHVANPSHLVGHFNAHLRDVITLFADEAFFAGDKRHESVLKMLITEECIPIEAKGIDTEPYPNYVHLIMASNDPHVIRATGDERRYFVLDMGEGNKQDSKYFSAITKQMENGGYEALLYHLQSLDISDYEVRDIPQTEALQEQKLLSLNIEEEWWFRKLQNGRLLDDDPQWNERVLSDALTTDFTDYAQKWNFSRRGNETSLGKFLQRVCPHVRKLQQRITVDRYDGDGRPSRIGKRAYFYTFGPLQKCRDSWDNLYGKTKWDEPVRLDEDQPIANI